MFIVVSYDIVDDKRRNKIAKELENYGTRVQYSVFETILGEEKFKELLPNLNSLLDENEDSLRIYYLCESCLKKTKVYGVGEISKDEEIYIV